MKGKQLAILLVLVAVLGGAWFFKSKQNTASWSETSAGAGGKVVEFPINDVAQLVIKSGGAELSLVKKADAWTVKERADYPANFESVGNLLRKLWELKTVQEVKVGASQLGRLELDEKAGTVVEFKDKDGKALATLLLGKKHMRQSDGASEFGGPSDGFAVGRYVKAIDGAKVSLVSETLEEVQTKPENWLLKDFLKIDGPKAITLAGTTDAQRWSITRDTTTADWKLTDAKPDEKLDSGKVSAVANFFSSPSFHDVLAPDAKLEEPVNTATIETFDGFRYEVKIGKLSAENYPVQVKVSGTFPKERTPGKDEKPEDKKRLDGEFAMKQKTLNEKLANEQKLGTRTYLVAKYLVEPLLKDRSALLPDKPTATPAPAPPAPVTATTPPVTVPKVEATTPPVQVPPAPAKPATPKPAATPAAPAPKP